MGPIIVPGTEAANQPVVASMPAGQTPIVPPAPGQVPPAPTPPTETSTAKTVIVVLTLLFVYPLGVILMYVLTKWKGWVKFLLTLPLILFLVGIAAAAVLIAIDPKGQIEKAECVSQCQQSTDVQSCVAQCIEMPVTSISPVMEDTGTTPNPNDPAGGTYLEGQAPEGTPSEEMMAQ